MKDLGYYKNIINQRYNPEKKELTHKKFYYLRKRIGAGDKESVNELYELTCCHAYDLIARAYAEKMFKVEFEDALQTAAFILYRMKIGELKTQFKTNYFADLTHGTNFKIFEYDIMSKIFKNLKKMEMQEEISQLENTNDSHKINSLLQTPESFAISSLDRKELEKLVISNGTGTNETQKKLSGVQTWLWLSGKATLKELSKEFGNGKMGNRQAAHYHCKRTLANIASHQDENGIKEFLR